MQERLGHTSATIDLELEESDLDTQESAATEGAAEATQERDEKTNDQDAASGRKAGVESGISDAEYDKLNDYQKATRQAEG